MRASDPTDTGVDLDAAGSADDLVALVQRAVERSGADAATTRHYVGIEGGTSADIRLHVSSVDAPTPLLTFAITTARSARGTAAASFLLQHNVEGKRRRRSLVGEEPFVAFLRSLATLVVEADPAARVSVRVQGERTDLNPRAEQEPPAVVQASPSTAPTPDRPAVEVPVAAVVPAPVPEPVVPGPPASVPAAPGPAAPDQPADPAPSAEPAPPVATAPAPVAPPSEPVHAAAPPAQPPVVQPPVTTPSSSVAPELQITVPPGLISAPPVAAPDPVDDAPPSAAPPTAVAPPVVEASRQQGVDATIVSAALRGGTLALELPDGERIPLHRALLLGRNPSAHPEQPGAELRALLDPRMSVSKTHTAVVPGRRSLRVTDLHSTNGTTITDAAGAVTVCRPGEAYVAEPGSTIGIGEFPIRVVSV